jgi:phosphatidylserine/phosphatidylglycerophosphate/cardiolipin synthase-like enzyme
MRLQAPRHVQAEICDFPAHALQHGRSLIAALVLSSVALCAEPGPVDAKAEVYFSPDSSCAEVVVRELGQAKRSVLVQAYSFTSPTIAQAMVDAQKRGVKVKVILDRSQRSDPESCADFLANAGVHVRIDTKQTKAHNKIVIIDEDVVLTGSFNLNSPGEERISDNLIVLHSKELAAKYIENWMKHHEHAKKYQAKEQQ